MSKFHNEKGVTLLEVLAATIILTLISIVIIAILQNSNTTSNKQMDSSNQLNDVTHIIGVITKDARKSNELLNSTPDEYTFKNNQNTQVYTYIFNRNDQTLTRNTEIIATNVLEFSIVSNVIDITTSNNKNFKSTIYFRR